MTNARTEAARNLFVSRSWDNPHVMRQAATAFFELAHADALHREDDFRLWRAAFDYHLSQDIAIEQRRRRLT